MTHELYYTSAPRGLVTGSKGFCSVAMTRGIPSFLSERLEDLSGYKTLFSALDSRNPVNWARFRLDLGEKTFHVLSRICAAGLDYSERTNKFAHHFVLTPDELPTAGPAWLLQQKGFLERAWDQGEPRWLVGDRKPPHGNPHLQVCKAWFKVTRDAGWAGVLAETALAVPAKPAILLYEPGTDVLTLFAEALLLLPAKYRWRVTFSTYATSVPHGETCLWRGLPKVEGDSAKNQMIPGALVIDLTKSLGQARGGVLVEAARSGKAVDVAAVNTDQTFVPSPKSRHTVLDDSSNGDQLPQVSLSSLSPSRKTSPGESGERDSSELGARRYLEIG